MGADNGTPNIGQVTRNTLTAYRNGLPRLQSALNAQIAPGELARLNAAELTLPRYNNLLNTTAASQARNEANILDTSGRDRAQTATEIDKGINPEFYVGKQATLNSLLEQLNELAFKNVDTQAERYVNQENIRSGNLDAPRSGTVSTANALKFGDERMKRVDALTKALGNANTFLTNSRATFDPFGRSTVEGAVNVPEAPRFGDIGSQVGKSSDTLLSNIFGVANNNASINSQNRDGLDRFNETSSSMPSYS